MPSRARSLLPATLTSASASRSTCRRSKASSGTAVRGTDVGEFHRSSNGSSRRSWGATEGRPIAAGSGGGWTPARRSPLPGRILGANVDVVAIDAGRPLSKTIASGRGRRSDRPVAEPRRSGDRHSLGASTGDDHAARRWTPWFDRRRPEWSHRRRVGRPDRGPGTRGRPPGIVIRRQIDGSSKGEPDLSAASGRRRDQIAEGHRITFRSP